MAQKPNISLSVEPADKESLYNLAAGLGFINPPGSGNWAGRPSVRRFIIAMAVAYRENPAGTVRALNELGISDPLPPDPDYWKPQN